MTKKEIYDGVMYQSWEEEIANGVTHGIAFVGSLFAGWFLWCFATGASIELRLSVVVFAFTAALVFLVSTLSHLVHHPAKRARLRALDQGAIYLMIAGTYSPFICTATDGSFRIVCLLAVWSLAFWGFYLKVFRSHRVDTTTSWTYVLLGWLPSVFLIYGTRADSLWWMMAGGVCYSGGLAFWYLGSKVRFTHSLWHLMVIAGASCHGYGISQLL